MFGSKTESQQKFGGKKRYHEFNQEISARMIQASPMIVVKAQAKTFTPYAKAGAVVGLFPRVTYTEKGFIDEGLIGIDFPPETEPLPIPGEVIVPKHTEFETIQEADGKVSLGITGIVGIEYSLSRTMHVFSEFRVVSLTYSPRKAEITKYYENGNDQLSKLSEKQKVTLFKDDSKISEAATEVKPIKLPFSSAGINIGPRYSF